MASRNDDGPASRDEFVTLMLEVAKRDRAKYREMRSNCQELAAISHFLDGKSELPN